MSTYLTMLNGLPRLVSAIAASLGTPDADKIPRLNSQGLIDSSMLPAGLAATPTHPGFNSGSYYYPEAVTTGAASSAGNLFGALLFYTPIAANFDRIMLQVTTASAAGGRARAGVYSVNNTGRITSLIVESGELAIDSTGIKEAAIDLTLQPGWYAFASLSSVTASYVCCANAGRTGYFYGVASLPGATIAGLRANASYGAMSSFAPNVAVVTSTNIPLVALRKS